MTVDQLLTDALHEQAAHVRPDPDARAVIARRLEQAHQARPTRRGPLLAAVAVAASVAAVAVSVTLATGRDDVRQAGGGPGRLPGYPLPAASFFPAVAGGSGPGSVTRTVVVRASDGSVVGTVPAAPSGDLTQPQLTGDGERAYAVWGPMDDRLGYVNLRTGTYRQLVRRPGQLASPTLSADGRTLAYEWIRDPNAATASVVVRNLRAGTERVLTGLPSGPQAVSLALSPDGRRLALVPTDRTPRPLWLVSTQGSAVFTSPTVVGGVTCRYGGWADEPRWTSAGLYAVRHCHSPQGTVITADVLRVDAARHRAVLAHRFGAATILFIHVVPHHGGPLVVTWDASVDPSGGVVVRDPSHGWRGARVRGVTGLDVSGSE